MKAAGGGNNSGLRSKITREGEHKKIVEFSHQES